MNDRIENYFNENLPPSDREQFEADLQLDPQLREDVAFYLKTRQVLREQALTERHTEWQQTAPAETRVRRLSPWQYATAAMVVLSLSMVWFWLSGTRELSRPQLAQAYVEEEFGRLQPEMGGEADSLQMAIRRYNEKQYAAALTIGEDMLRRNPNDGDALRVAGAASLRQQKYGQAIDYFHRIAAQPEPYDNPGKFYEALAHLQRNEPPDKKEAEELLNEVISGDLTGRKQAEQWLKAAE